MQAAPRRFLLAALAALAPFGAALAEPYVILNGRRLTDPELAQLEAYACTPIPNGNYWLNTATGLWGMAGDPAPRGHIRDCCNGQCARPGLSQRGRLFTPYDWVR